MWCDKLLCGRSMRASINQIRQNIWALESGLPPESRGLCRPHSHRFRVFFVLCVACEMCTQKQIQFLELERVIMKLISSYLPFSFRKQSLKKPRALQALWSLWAPRPAPLLQVTSPGCFSLLRCPSEGCVDGRAPHLPLCGQSQSSAGL